MEFTSDAHELLFHFVGTSDFQNLNFKSSLPLDKIKPTSNQPAFLKENEYSIKTTTDFAERLKNRTVDDDEVLVSYDVSFLFTEVPLDETTDHPWNLHQQHVTTT